MNSNDAAVEVALLEIAKDLLQASDDLAATDPSASAKLAHEAYEIGRDLGIVRNHLGPAETSAQIVHQSAPSLPQAYAETSSAANGGGSTAPRSRVAEEEGDDELFRILDRQRAVVPNFAELKPARRPSRNDKQMTFEVPAPRRSGWFGWMRSRDLRHAG